MATEGHVIVGSGMKPQLEGICENTTTGERHQTGTNVVVINPEDASAGGPFQAVAVTVTTSATRILSTPLKYRRAIAIRNNGASTIYLGENDSVTTSTGFPLKADEIFTADATVTGELWAIAGASVDVRVIELA